MTDPSETPEKIHWATKRRLEREIAIREGREPPPFTAPREQIKQVGAGEPPKAAHLEGLGPKNCPTACNPEKGCAITGDICGHPSQSGLQSPHRMKPDVVRRYQEAVAYLQHLAVDRRTD